jgi:hypothetical protein
MKNLLFFSLFFLQMHGIPFRCWLDHNGCCHWCPIGEHLDFKSVAVIYNAAVNQLVLWLFPREWAYLSESS